MILFPYAGSSSKVAGLIAEIIQVEGYKVYAEPMVGSGAVFFKLRPARAILGDIDWLHMNLYFAIKDRHERVIDILRTIPPTREEFDTRLAAVHSMEKISETAATWYYLLWLCYNGVYLKKDGKPYMTFGDRYLTWEKRLPARERNIRDASILLRGAGIHCGDFTFFPHGDIAFFDPPWIGSKEDYGVEFDHPRLAEYLEGYGHKWLMTINHCQQAEDIYYGLAEWSMGLSSYYSVAPVAHGRGDRRETLLANFHPRMFGG